MTWPVTTCLRPLFVFFDVEAQAYMLQIRYLINVTDEQHVLANMKHG
jgi:hypothetical protein